MKSVNPYLNFLGTTEEAFNFYKSIFGGEFAMVQRYKDSPEAGQVGPDEANKLMHIALPIGKGNVLMGTDALASQGHSLKAGNNFHLSLSADSKEEADKVFNGLSAGGSVMVPMSKMFWGSYFGMCTDKFGVQWMVSFDSNPS
jgi:PhnB protein